MVSTSQDSLDIAELRKYLKQRLPEHMMPSAIVLLDQLPLTRSGKINRQSLPLPKETDNARAALYAGPQNELERAIAATWQKALRLEKVSIYENFFELGGHSLLMIEVHRALREKLQRAVPLVELFRFPTISSLASFLKRGERAETDFLKIDDRVRKREEALERRRQFNRERKQHS